MGLGPGPGLQPGELVEPQAGPQPDGCPSRRLISSMFFRGKPGSKGSPCSFPRESCPPPRLSVSTTLHSPAKSRRGLGAPVPECGYRCARPAPAAASGPAGMPDREASQGPLGFRGPSSSGCPRWSDEEDPTLGPQSESEGQHRPEWTRHALSLGEARKEPCG